MVIKKAENMPTGANAVTVQPERKHHGFQPGQSGNPAGSRPLRERQDQLRSAIKIELGDALSLADSVLVDRCVELLTTRSRSHVDNVRAVNIANRILRELREKYCLKDETVPTLDMYEKAQ